MSVSRETPPDWAHVVSRETLSRVSAFKDLLSKWNPRVNLVAPGDLPHLDTRHVADSLAILPFVPLNTNRAIDLGSGAGFPGLILAIASGIHFDLIESDHRKAAFLMEAARLTKAPVKIIPSRIENATCAPARLITSRALAPLERLIGLATPLLETMGVCLFSKGRNFQREITDAQKLWSANIVAHQSVTCPEGAILEISNVARA